MPVESRAASAHVVCMSEITTFLPLAWDRNEERFLPEAETTEFLIKRKTGGRPSLVRDEHNDPVTVAVDAELDDLELIVDHEPGSYLLYQINPEGEFVKGTIAQVIIGNPGSDTSDPKYEQMTHFAARLIQANTMQYMHLVAGETDRAIGLLAERHGYTRDRAAEERDQADVGADVPENRARTRAQGSEDPEIANNSSRLTSPRSEGFEHQAGIRFGRPSHTRRPGPTPAPRTCLRVCRPRREWPGAPRGCSAGWSR